MNTEERNKLLMEIMDEVEDWVPEVQRDDDKWREGYRCCRRDIIDCILDPMLE